MHIIIYILYFKFDIFVYSNVEFTVCFYNVNIQNIDAQPNDIYIYLPKVLH